MIRRALVLVFSVIFGNAAAQSKPEAAWLIYQGQQASPSVEIWRLSESTPSFVWRLTASNNSLIAEMPEPALPKNYMVNQGQCKVGGVFRNDVLAIVRHKEGVQWSRDVRAMWVADPKNKAFISTPVKDVECLNESWGV